MAFPTKPPTIAPRIPNNSAPNIAKIAKIPKEEIDKIKSRNCKVEIDKAWEVSYTRRVALMLFTYLSVGFYLAAIKVQNPWLNAIVPSIAFMLSTLTLPFFKKIWIKIMNSL